MATGWGCQFLTKANGVDDWCKRLKIVCKPGTKGCILDGEFVFSDPTAGIRVKEDYKPKNRSDNPLGR